MATETKDSTSPFAPIMFLFWLANLIYTCMYWGGWAIVFNIFVPYAMIFDFITKMGRIR